MKLLNSTARKFIFLQQECHGDGVDLYDDVIAAPQGSEENVNPNRIPQGAPPVTPGPSPNGLAFPPKNPQILQRFQLYVGNLTWVLFSFSFIFFVYFLNNFKAYSFILQLE